MSATYRVRYVPNPSDYPRSPDKSLTVDLGCSLDQVPEQLPAEAYILSIEDLAAGRDIHWTRWPEAFRPGFGERTSVRVR
jgi:hypothetical protein